MLFRSQLRDSRVMIELLISSMSAPDKRELLQRIAIGTVDIVVGTQALLSEHVEFANLGLLVIDEQHRFGVEQRAALRSSRTTPHYLVMTATPIPRTLALTLFGDLDVSTVRERPPGQSVVQTYLLKPELHERWWTFVKQQVAAGRQAYVVVPRVDADQDQETQGAVQWWEMLSQGALSGLRVELLHGRMESSHKQAVLERFAQGGIDVLVATTVIEVGIDVPNVSVMTIIDADRLGLAQLHQLRGRVGRGKHPGFVSLIPNPAVLDEDTERLELFAKIHDGFKLAEMDLQRRGPGELIGTKQTGLPEFRIADLIRDEAIVMVARELATLLVAADPQLERPEHAKLLRQVLSKHGRTMSIGDVG